MAIVSPGFRYAGNIAWENSFGIAATIAGNVAKPEPLIASDLKNCFLFIYISLMWVLITNLRYNYCLKATAEQLLISNS